MNCLLLACGRDGIAQGTTSSSDTLLIGRKHLELSLAETCLQTEGDGLVGNGTAYNEIGDEAWTELVLATVLAI